MLSLGRQLFTKAEGSHAAAMAWPGAPAAPQIYGQRESTLGMGSKQVRILLGLVRRPAAPALAR
jgi:hypothetical protein